MFMPVKECMNQFVESVRKQQENQEKTLPSTFAWSLEVAEHNKKKEEAKQYWAAKKAEESKETEVNWLPEKKPVSSLVQP